jgi:hypothetical protein
VKSKVIVLADTDPGVEGVIRCAGDVDEFAALAQRHLLNYRARHWDAPMALLPPVFSWWRWVPTPDGEFDRVLYPAAGPGPGAWQGAEIRIVQIGCSECQLVGGRHADGCLNANITSLVTCQFSRDKAGPMSDTWVHAVRSRGRAPGVLPGTPGPTLCGIPRFGPDSTGWSLGGGSWSPRKTYHGCYQCGKVARAEFPGRRITGLRQFAEAFTRDTAALPPMLGFRTANGTAHTSEAGCL